MQPVNPSFETLVNNAQRFPIGRVSVYETTKSVPSLGFNAAYYAIGQETDMDVVDWWSGLPTTNPTGVLDEGTFLSGSSIIEESTIMAFDWGVAGVPPPISGRNDLWAMRQYGFFFARFSGVYTFHMDSSPHTQMRMVFDSSVAQFEDDDSVVVDRWAGSNYEKTRQELHWDSPSLVAGTWYPIQIEFHVPKQSDPQNVSTYLCMKYEEPDATTDLDLWGNSGGDIVPDYQSDVGIKKVLSAGVVNTTNSFLSPIVIPWASGFSGSRRQGQSTDFNFTVPIPATTNIEVQTAALDTEIEVDSVDGFPTEGALGIGTNPDSMDIVTYTGLDTANNKFTGVSGVGVNVVGALVNQLLGLDNNQYVAGYDALTGAFGPIKGFRLIQIEGGLYDGTSTDYYSDRIWGNLSQNPIIDRDNKSVSWIVRDSSWMLNRKYDKNYPNQASYSMAGYYEAFTSTNPEGVARPICYDRWTSGNAVRDIFMLAGVDPVLLFQRERIAISASPAFASDYGRYLVSGDLILDGNPRYGHPESIEQLSPDDRYMWQFGYGTTLFENIAEIVRVFAYNFGFTPNGFAKSQPIGLPDNELIISDAEVTSVDTAQTWLDKASTGALSAFKAKYIEPDGTPSVGMKVLLSAQFFNDLDLIVGRHSGASQVIKLKVDGVFQTSLIIDGQTVAGTGGGGDEFDITRSAGDWFFNDGVDTSGFNPSIIKIAAPVAYTSKAVELEVVSGVIRFNAFFLYSNSSRTTIRDIDETVMSTLRMEKDIENQRNEIAVIGALQGVARTVDGQIINTNNPIYIHVVSRSTDLGSIYDSSSKNYIGHIVSTEIYDERILDQERADYVSIFALREYREQLASGAAEIMFDPRLDILDSIGMTDVHSNVMDGRQVWLSSISEIYAIDAAGIPSYTTRINDATQREPLPSMRFKPEPDLSDWDGEPIVNINLFYRGYRAAGNDASQVAQVITIANSPGWVVNMWAGYFISDETGHLYEIESNTADTVTLVEFPSIWEGINWAITFDPLDAENGEPIDIRYDQISNAKVEIQIVGKNGRLIANLNEDTRDTIVNWGPNKRILWNGEVQFGAREGRVDYLVSKYTLFEFREKLPIAIRFISKIQNQSTGAEETVSIVSHSENIDGTTIYTEPFIHSTTREGEVTLHNPNGAAKIIPRILDGGYYIGARASGNVSGSDNTIIDAGRLIEVIDQGGGLYRLMIEGRGSGGFNPFSLNEFNGKWVMSGKSGAVSEIIDTGFDADDGWIEIQMPNAVTAADYLKHSGFEGTFNLWRNGDLSDTRDDAEYPWLKIVENQHQSIAFKQSDNSGLGLKLKFTSPDFWVENINENMFLDGISIVASSGSLEIMLQAKFKTICENELTINYEGNIYTIPAGSDIKLAQNGAGGNQSALDPDDNNRYSSGILDSGFKSLNISFQIYWSKYYPTKLWMSAGQSPDAHNPTEGTFVIADIINLKPRGRSQRSVFIRCPKIAPKAKSFVMAPYMEIHQIASGDIITQAQIDAGRRPVNRNTAGEIGNILTENLDFELDLPAYNEFTAARDLFVTVNPSSLQQSDGPSESLYFWRSLTNGNTPDRVVWEFLIKQVIFDRIGRTPLNLPDFDIFDQEDQEEVTSTDFTFTDWNAIVAFWHPESGFTTRLIQGGTNWEFIKFNASNLNLQRLLPISEWIK